MKDANYTRDSYAELDRLCEEITKKYEKVMYLVEDRNKGYSHYFFIRENAEKFVEELMRRDTKLGYWIGIQELKEGSKVMGEFSW